METLFKVAITGVVVCLVYYQLLFLRSVWRSQIDPRATFSRLLDKLKTESDIIATRDPLKIYQAGESVGDVTGAVTQDGATWTFKQISNTTRLQPDRPFEYQRTTLRVVQIGSRTGFASTTTVGGTSNTATDVLEDVTCEVAQR